MKISKLHFTTHIFSNFFYLKALIESYLDGLFKTKTLHKSLLLIFKNTKTLNILMSCIEKDLICIVKYN